MAGLSLTLVLIILAVAGVVVAVIVVLTLLAMMLRVRRLRRRGLEARAVADRLVALAREGQDMPSVRDLHVDRRTLGDAVAARVPDLDARTHVVVLDWLRSEGFVESALRHSSSRLSWNRAFAATQLGNMRAPEGVDALIRLLTDDDSEVRVAAVLALADVLDGAAAPIVADHVRSGSLPDRVALAALKRMGPSAATGVAEMLFDRDARVRRVAVASVAHRGDRQSAAALLARAGDVDLEVRRRVLSALFVVDGHCDPTRLRNALRAGAEDPHPEVRAAAATAIGALLGSEGLPLLRHLAHDPSFWVTARARAAISAVEGTAVEGYSSLPADAPWTVEHQVRLVEAMGDAQATPGASAGPSMPMPLTVG